MANAISQRNGEIELFRFIAALLIINHHSIFFCKDFKDVLFPFGSLCVDFFFLLSGFLMARSIAKRPEERTLSSNELSRESFQFVWRKICSFYPELLVCSCIGLLVYSMAHPDVSAIGKNVYQTILSCGLLLNMTGLSKFGVIGGTWYLSSMLLGMAVLYPLIRRYGVSSYLIAFALLLLGTSYALNPQMGFLGVKEWEGILTKGNIRAFAEMALGAGLFSLSEVIRRVAWSLWVRCFFTGVKVVSSLLVFLTLKRCSIILEPLALLCFCVIIVLSFSRVCLDESLYQKSWCLVLGKLSLPLYLGHQFYAQNIRHFLPPDLPNWEEQLIYITCSFATALFAMHAAGFLRRHVRFTVATSCPSSDSAA